MLRASSSSSVVVAHSSTTRSLQLIKAFRYETISRLSSAAAAVKAAPSARKKQVEVVVAPASQSAIKIAAGSRRTGAVALKMGMVRLFDPWGVAIPATVLALEDVVVFKQKSEARGDNVTSVVLAAGPVKEKHVPKTVLGEFVNRKVDLRRHLTEFRVTEDALLPAGTPIHAQHFVPGQLVDVQGTSIGHGFQGAMKRYGFKGQGASHGTSAAHRTLGGTGAAQDPGKTWPGKKMHGHMGDVTRTVQNLKVFAIDPVRNLVIVKGHVPGHAGTLVKISDAIREKNQFEKMRLDVPFPTFKAPPTAARALYEQKPGVEREQSTTSVEVPGASVSTWLYAPKAPKDPLYTAA